ncbi:uncharacterized protein LOC132832670 isoform X1 [Hemiscyllium ocellatum]|uniref:uncharacterized protein LOC132832670 isoform X1 n=1 Tax=Hemiscyllium ocellatum TaxID=170820 RepID=UPI002965D0E5|nr:uncharacterized protein LOC132832670 isoform X1 [Hemiscyllium ocellatum]
MCSMELTPTQLILFPNNSNSASAVRWIVISIVLYILEEITEKQIPCPCTSPDANSESYRMVFAIPAVLLFFLAMVLQHKKKYKNFEEIWEECQRCQECESKAFAVSFCKSVSLSIIWIGILFLDGDYYACSQNMNDEKMNSTICSKLSCERNPDIFLPEYGRNCNYSRRIGAGLLTTWVILVLICYLFQPDEQHQTKHTYHIKLIEATQGRITEPLPHASTNEDNMISLLQSRLPISFTATIQTVSDEDNSTSEVRENSTDGPSQEAEGPRNES